MKIQYIKKLVGFCLVMISLLIVSCKKLVEVPAPKTGLSGQNIFDADKTATSVLLGEYTYQSSWSSSPLAGVLTTYPALLADELVQYDDFSGYYRAFKNNLNPTQDEFWSAPYASIFRMNSAIEGLQGSTKLTTKVKNQLLGEALFMRSLSYFYLTNMVGDVPLIISTDFNKNTLLPRVSVETVYQQVIKDLNIAESIMSESYVDNTSITSTTDRIRPNKWGAAALLARVYLYNKDFDKAKIEASKIIANNSIYSLMSMSNVFQAASNTETIWELQPVERNYNTWNAATYVIPPTGFSFGSRFYLNQSLLDDFEPNDQRRVNWIGKYSSSNPVKDYYYAAKYTVMPGSGSVTEKEIVFRLAEQYLIRAEAYAQLNDLDNAVADLNVIRKRAGLPDYNGIKEKNIIINAILHERRVELFVEWGHRWLDLKRLGKVDEVMNVQAPLKGGTWNSNKALYPIPQDQIRLNPNLKQNPGY